MNYKLNANKSLDDSRDWLYQNKNSKILPSILDYRPQLQPVRNQGTDESLVLYPSSVCVNSRWWGSYRCCSGM